MHAHGQSNTQVSRTRWTFIGNVVTDRGYWGHPTYPTRATREKAAQSTLGMFGGQTRFLDRTHLPRRIAIIAYWYVVHVCTLAVFLSQILYFICYAHDYQRCHSHLMLHLLLPPFERDWWMPSMRTMDSVSSHHAINPLALLLILCFVHLYCCLLSKWECY